MFHYKGHTYTPIPEGEKLKKGNYMRILYRFDRIHPDDVGSEVKEHNTYFTRDKKPLKKTS